LKSFKERGNYSNDSNARYARVVYKFESSRSEALGQKTSPYKERGN
jgi:hypothetical protein